MAMNRVQFQPGLSMTEFLTDTAAKTSARRRWLRRAGRRALPARHCGSGVHTVFVARRAPLLAVRRLPSPMQRHQRHDFRGDEIGADALVRSHAPAHPVQEQRLCA